MVRRGSGAGTWQVQEAKQRLSEVLRAAESSGPQVISRRGEDVAVVVDISDYRRLAGVQVELADFLRHGPVADDLEVERDAGSARVPDLTDADAPER